MFFDNMISPDIFLSTDIEFSEKWDRSSATYTPEDWKRNNGRFSMLSLGRKCKNRKIIAQSLSNDAQLVSLILL